MNSGLFSTINHIVTGVIGTHLARAHVAKVLRFFWRDGRLPGETPDPKFKHHSSKVDEIFMKRLANPLGIIIWLVGQGHRPPLWKIWWSEWKSIGMRTEIPKSHGEIPKMATKPPTRDYTWLYIVSTLRFSLYRKNLMVDPILGEIEMLWDALSHTFDGEQMWKISVFTVQNFQKKHLAGESFYL